MTTIAATTRTLPLRISGRGWLLASVALPGLIVLVLAILGPWIAPDPLGANVAPPFRPPGAGHPFGTDRLGRDVLSQTLYGSRALLVIPLIATGVSVVFGAVVGMFLGFVRGWADLLVLPVVDLLLVLPNTVVILILAAGWGGGPGVVVLAMLLNGSPFLIRLARSSTLHVAHAPYVDVALTQGDGTFTILRRDILPNVLGPILADSGMRFLGALYLVAALSLLGFGPQPPDTNWAVMIRENAEGAGLNIWALVVPAGCIALLTIGVNIALQAVADRFAR